MRRILTPPAIFALLLIVPAFHVSAQDEPPSPWRFTVEGGGLAQGNTDLSDAEGEYSLDRWFVSAGVDYAWDRRTSLGLSLGGGRTTYDFDSFPGIDEGGPWEKIDDLRLTVTGRFGFGERGSAFILPSVRYYNEKGADRGDGRTWGVLAGAAWWLSEDLTIGPGIGVFSRLADSTRVFPILIIDWDIADRWNLSTGGGLAASQGPGLTLRYTLSDAWSFALAGRFEEIEFRLDDEGVAPGGVGRDKSFPLVLTARLQPDPRISVGFFAGIEFLGKLRVFDSFDTEISSQKYDPAPIFGGLFEFRY